MSNQKQKRIPLWAKILAGAGLAIGIGWGISALAKGDGVPDGEKYPPNRYEPGDNPGNAVPSDIPGDTDNPPPSFSKFKGQQCFLANMKTQGLLVYTGEPITGDAELCYSGEPLGKFTGVMQKYTTGGKDYWYLEMDGKAERWTQWKKPVWVQADFVRLNNQSTPFYHFINMYYNYNVGAVVFSDDDKVLEYAKSICKSDSWFWLIYNARLGKKYNSLKDLLTGTTGPFNETQYKQFINNLKPC